MTDNNQNIIKYATNNNGNNGLVLVVTYTSNTYTAYVYSAQYTPEKSCLLYRFDVGSFATREEAMAQASKLLAEKLRLAASFFESKFINKGN